VQQKELAALLGVSQAMVSRHIKMGMPSDSLERAQKWRRRKLVPSRVKGVRLGTAEALKPGVPPAQDYRAPSMTSPRFDDHDNQDDQVGESEESLIEARRRLMVSDANQAEAKESETMGRLVAKASVEKAVYEAARALRDGMTNCSRRMAAEVATLTTPAECEEVISKELRHLLDAFSRELAQKVAITPADS
jgi:hypothetical protein